MLAEIEATAPTNGISAAERAKRLTELDAAQLEAERREAALIYRAAADGIEIKHRPSADPKAILGITIIETPADMAEAA